ncbi:hypothetical protein ACN38_g5037 [Penicillium nordicum]|uniref:Uncharacterized protein n=1 Tax=Penicillium nordicum TaxID=229535 RepID=A0A0M9WGK3_9EURO|nr:hypothetical protein ACN38_g5037 [Penicillium nordicum]
MWRLEMGLKVEEKRIFFTKRKREVPYFVFARYNARTETKMSFTVPSVDQADSQQPGVIAGCVLEKEKEMGTCNSEKKSRKKKKKKKKTAVNSSYIQPTIVS